MDPSKWWIHCELFHYWSKISQRWWEDNHRLICNFHSYFSELFVGQDTAGIVGFPLPQSNDILLMSSFEFTIRWKIVINILLLSSQGTNVIWMIAGRFPRQRANTSPMKEESPFSKQVPRQAKISTTRSLVTNNWTLYWPPMLISIHSSCKGSCAVEISRQY